MKIKSLAAADVTERRIGDNKRKEEHLPSSRHTTTTQRFGWSSIQVVK